MSYILNALRKSEQERQAITPDSVTNRINVQQPLRQQKSTKLIIAALIVCNLVILAYFLWPTQQTPPTVVSQTVMPIAKPMEAPLTEIISSPLPVTSGSEQKTPAIADIVEARTAPTPPVASKPPLSKKPLFGLDKPALAPPAPVIQKIEPLKETAKEPVVVAPPIAIKEPIARPALLPLKNDLPFVEEMPSDLRRSLPNFTINVFGYSSVPAQRFVMIDMVKYVPGQRIKDLLDLKEIREDSIVVNYNDQTFKIKRP